MVRTNQPIRPTSSLRHRKYTSIRPSTASLEREKMDSLISNEIKEFLIFTTELYEELGSQRYCADIIDSFGSKSLLTLTCEKFNIPILSICGEIQLENGHTLVGMWQLLLTREKIKEHVFSISFSSSHFLDC